MSVELWPSTLSLANLIRGMEKYKENYNPQFEYPTVTYRAKPKIDGSNASIHKTKDGIRVFSRNEELSEKNTLAGFYPWAKSIEEAEAINHIPEGTAIFGEWYKKKFYVFGVTYELNEKVCIEYGFASLFFKFCLNRPDLGMYVVPFLEGTCTIEFGSITEDTIKKLNEFVQEVVEKNDFIRSIDPANTDAGEGCVFYPVVENDIEVYQIYRENWGHRIFKAVGTKHQVRNQKAPVEKDIEKASSVTQFCTYFLTDKRIEQARNTLPADSDNKAIVAWLIADIQKESQDVLTESNLTWKDVQKDLTSACWKKVRNEIEWG